MRSHFLKSNTGSLTACVRRLRLAEGLAALSLVCLIANVFAAASALQAVALLLLAGSMLAGWSAVLAWRIPVLPTSRILLLGSIWAIGLAASVLLVLWADGASRGIGLRVATYLLAASLSLCVGALFFRALFRKRSTPRTVRALSLLSPIAVLVLILVQLFD